MAQPPAFVVVSQRWCDMGGSTQLTVPFAAQGDRSRTSLSVQPVPSDGTSYSQDIEPLALGCFTADAGYPSSVWGTVLSLRDPGSELDSAGLPGSWGGSQSGEAEPWAMSRSERTSLRTLVPFYHLWWYQRAPEAGEALTFRTHQPW